MDTYGLNADTRNHAAAEAYKPYGFEAAPLTEVFAVLGAVVPSCSDVQAVTATVAGVVFRPCKPANVANNLIKNETAVIQWLKNKVSP